jgi:hypothetical protein
MKILDLNGSIGRDLYGRLQCEHCHDIARLRGGYDDAFWHGKVLPALHCLKCGMNRAGQIKSQEVTASNQASGVNGI